MPDETQPQLPEAFGRPATFAPGGLESPRPTGAGQGAAVGALVARLRSHVRRFDLGTVLAAGTGFVLAEDPLLVRTPAVGFVTRARMGVSALLHGYFPGAPDLAVEVVAATDTASSLQEQLDDYFGAGARQVWQIFPQLRKIVVQHGSRASVLRESDTLDGGALLPGFICRVAELLE